MDNGKKPSFLLVGEILVDLISTEVAVSLGDTRVFTKYAGGEVANLAMNLAKLGFPSYLGACIGEDGFGRFLRQQLESAGVRLDTIQTTSQAPTTLVPVSKNAATPDFSIYRGADQYLRLSDEFKVAADQAFLLHTSAFALSREPCRGTILNMIKSFRKAGKLISLDPNYHPRIWPDIPNFLAVLKEIISQVTIIKPSLDDSNRIFGPGHSADTYLDFFLELGPEIVLLTMGKDGTKVGTAAGDRYHVLPNHVDVVDVTGAGDAFWSGFFTGLVNDLSPLEAARLGQVIAEHKISLLGPISDFYPIKEYLSLARNTRFT